MSISDRAGLLEDAFNLARAKMINYSVALDLTSYLRNETKYVPWEAAVTNLDYLRRVLPITGKAYKYLQTYSAYQAEPHYKRLGFKDSGTHLEKYNRVNMLHIFCRDKRKDCLDTVQVYFKKWMEDPVNNQVPPDFRSLVYYYGVANGGEKEWDFVFEQFRKSNVASEKRKLMYAMAATKEPWILERYLAYSLDTSKIRPQDTIRLTSYIANYNSIGGQLAWNYVRYNWNQYMKRYSGALFGIDSLISAVTRTFTSEFQLNELITFIAKHPDAGSGKRALQQSVERVKANIKWLKENEKDVEEWLDKFLKDRSLL